MVKLLSCQALLSIFLVQVGIINSQRECIQPINIPIGQLKESRENILQSSYTNYKFTEIPMEEMRKCSPKYMAKVLKSSIAPSSKIQNSITMIYGGQPYTITLAVSTAWSRQYDSRCYTYFPVPKCNTSYVGYEGRVFLDGSFEVISCIVSDGRPGVVRASTSSCFYTDTTFASVTGCNVDLVRRNYLYGNCSSEGSCYGGDHIYGVSPGCTVLNSTCQKKVLSVLSDYGYCNQTYFFYPMKFPKKCVVRQPSSNCINQVP